MRPILFDKTSTTFTTNGIGRLNPLSCIVSEVRNGEYEAELVVNRNDKYFPYIDYDSLIRMKVSDGTEQTFRVYDIVKTLENDITVKCQHISYDLSYIPVDYFNASSCADALSGIETNSLVSNTFTFDTDIVSSATFAPQFPASARKYLGGMTGSILDVYGGEYKFNNKNVFLYRHRGSDNGVSIRYRKNIINLEDEVNSEDRVDGLLPYWTNTEYTVVGDIIKATNGNKIVTVDVSDGIELAESQTVPTKQQVNTAGQSALASLVTSAKQSLKVEYYQNPEISNVQLCDTVTVIFEPYNINAKLKVVRTNWDVLSEKYESIELGEYSSLSQTMTDIVNTVNDIDYDNGRIKIRLERTEDGLESEVTRATTAEGTLSSRITQNASAISLEVSRAQDEEDDIRASLDLKIDTDDDGTIISLINGSADNIHFGANNMFTVDSPNFSIDSSGDVEVVGSIEAESFEFTANGGSSYLRHQSLGDGSTNGLRIVNDNGSSIALGEWLWLRNDNGDVVVLSDSNFRPNTSGVDLGYSRHRWDWVYCENISCADPPWDSSSSDKRMKENFSVIDKLHDFYMSLEPLQYNFKEGVDFKDPELKHYGLIAQDVLSIYEKCYNTDKQGIVQKKEIVDDGTIEILGENKEYTINYNELHAYHISMIQELRKEVDELKEEIKKLKGETE